MRIPSQYLLALVVLLVVSGCETVPENLAKDQDPAKAAQIHAILERSIEVQGGREKLQKMTVWETQHTIESDPGNARFSIHAWQTVRGEYRYEITTPNRGTLMEAFDGRTGWRQNEQLGFGLTPWGDLIATRLNLAVHQALNVEKTHPIRRLLPAENVAGLSCDVIELTGTDGVAEKWFFDRASGRLVREERPGQAGRAQGVVLEYSDFRPVDGYPVAFLSKRTEGKTVQLFHLESAVFNPRIPSGWFSPSDQNLRDQQKSEEILQRHLAAVGGAAAASQIHSRVTRTTVQATTAGVTSHVTLSVKEPNRVLHEQDVPGVGRMVQGFDGTTAWANSDMQGYRVLQGAERQQLVSTGSLQSDVILSELYPMRKLFGEKTVDGRRTYVVALGNLQGTAGLHYFDAETGQLLRVETSFVAGPKGVLKATIDFADFRTVDGISMAYRTTVNNPAVHVIITIDSVQNNVPLDDAIFHPRKDD